MVEVEIAKRATQCGYVLWKRRQDHDMSKLLGRKETVDLVFMNADHGQ